MFEKLIDVLLAFVHEIKRYNDAAEPKSDVVATVEKATPKTTVEKAAPKTTVKAEKPVAKAKVAELTVADVQATAAKFIALPGKGRDAFIAVLKSLGYANISGANASDGAEGLRSINEALLAELAEVEADPAA